jgi:hypothetical protein
MEARFREFQLYINSTEKQNKKHGSILSYVNTNKMVYMFVGFNK